MQTKEHMKKMLRLIFLSVLMLGCMMFSACEDKDVLGVAEKEQQALGYKIDKCNLSAKEISGALTLYSANCDMNGAVFKDGYLSGRITKTAASAPVYNGTGSDLALFLSDHLTSDTDVSYFKIYISSGKAVQCWYSDADILKDVTYSEGGGYSVSDRDNIYGGYPAAAAPAS